MTITVEDVIGKYIEKRDEIARIESEAKERVGEIKAVLEKFAAWINLKAEQDGVESFKTAAGTAFFTTVDYAQVADWTLLLEYIQKNEAWDLLEKRVAKVAVRGILNDTKVLPPGVNYGTKREINVRKPTAKA